MVQLLPGMVRVMNAHRNSSVIVRSVLRALCELGGIPSVDKVALRVHAPAVMATLRVFTSVVQVRSTTDKHSQAPLTGTS